MLDSDEDGLPGTEKVWELDEKELVVDPKPFAKGAFSSVHRGEYFGTPVCVKVLKRDDPLNTEMVKFFRREISSLKFSHPNIVHLIGVAEKQDEIYIVTEYVAGGNLRQFLKDKIIPLPWELRIQIAIDIASGMAFLHSRNVIHSNNRPSGEKRFCKGACTVFWCHTITLLHETKPVWCHTITLLHETKPVWPSE